MTRPGLERRTVETCPYRVDRSADDATATCGLVAGLLGPDGGRHAAVGRDACASCCATFPPTPGALNPVTASMVYAALAGPEPPPLPPARVEALKRQAGVALLAALDDPTPAEPEAADGDASPRPLSRRPGVPRLGRHGAAASWAVGVTTAPRPEPTLDRCLESLARAGWERPHLFIDAAIDLPPRAAILPQTYRDSPLGAWPSYLLALHELVLRQPRADAYMIVQDDALFYEGEPVRPYLERHVLWPGREPDRSIVSLYCAAPYTRARACWRPLRSRWAWGALAFAFPNALARAFLLDPDVFAHRRVGRSDGLAHIDVVVGRWARRRGIGVWYPTPSLVQHIGETSTLWEGARALGDRRARRFLGDEAPPHEARD